jgi:hypothetical protein
MVIQQPKDKLSKSQCRENRWRDAKHHNEYTTIRWLKHTDSWNDLDTNKADYAYVSDTVADVCCLRNDRHMNAIPQNMPTHIHVALHLLNGESKSNTQGSKRNTQII